MLHVKHAAVTIPRMYRIPLIMTQPGRIRKGDHWAHTCPATPKCRPVGGVQGGEPGIRAHLRVAHPEWHGTLRCNPPCRLTLTV